MIYDDVLYHIGMPKRSGRYPWGSGKNPFQHGGDFLSRIQDLKNQGFSEAEIANDLGLSTTQLRVQKSLANSERRTVQVATARGLKEKGYTLSEITREMGFKNDSSVRSLLDIDTEARMNEAMKTADFLKDRIDSVGMIDVGKGVDKELNISKERLDQALYILELNGYPTYTGGVPQLTNPTRQTVIKVIGPPGTKHKDIFDYEKVNTVKEYISHDDGETFDTFKYPKSIDSKRISIKYAEDGGADLDGLVQIRRNVDDLSLGESRYSQVRILVDGNKYIKGMAVYSDDIPKGYDIVFNTNKTKDISKGEVLKTVKPKDEANGNPFGSYIKSPGGQSYYDGPNGKKELSAINKRADEGDWGKWADKLPSQFLSKQNINLIKKQLGDTLQDQQNELNDILALTNPTVKKALLQTYAETADASSVHLKAAALPGQKYQVILPVANMKDNEVYAPNYENGTKVALIRYPHGGTFEIPIVTVNNKHPEAKKMIGNAKDGVCINKNVADRLSGADFDGDTVQVIPLGKGIKITSTKPLKDLEGFDPKISYPPREGMKLMKNTNMEMGIASNLITDMTLKGASSEELARAVKHSMVVIDAEKHKLNYKQSYEDNGIQSLKEKYQKREVDGKTVGGASTLISQAKSPVYVDRYKGQPNIDPATGKVSYTEAFTPSQKVKTLDTRVDYKTGNTVVRKTKTAKLANTDDAFDLSSGTPQETAYALYANQMKALANKARKEMVATPSLKYSPSAKKTYATEVESLKAQLTAAELNKPRERRAQLLANSAVKAKTQAHPDITKEERKKIVQMELEKARISVGAKRVPITISTKEWEAIQAGAISDTTLSSILKFTDTDSVRALATPRYTSTLSTAKQAKLDVMLQSGNYTNAEMAKAIGVSPSTIVNYEANT